jgi:hypothetical protein
MCWIIGVLRICQVFSFSCKIVICELWLISLSWAKCHITTLQFTGAENTRDCNIQNIFRYVRRMRKPCYYLFSSRIWGETESLRPVIPNVTLRWDLSTLVLRPVIPNVTLRWDLSPLVLGPQKGILLSPWPHGHAVLLEWQSAEEIQRFQMKICPKATMPTVNATWIALVANPDSAVTKLRLAAWGMQRPRCVSA